MPVVNAYSKIPMSVCMEHVKTINLEPSLKVLLNGPCHQLGISLKYGGNAYQHNCMREKR